MPSPNRARLIAERLGDLIGETITEDARRLSSGASRETWALRDGSGRELIAQVDRRGTPRGDSPPQAPLLIAAAQAGVPVPAVVASGADDPVLGSGWTLVESIEGTTDPNQILAGDGVPDGEELIDDIAAALAAVHRIDPEAGLAPDPGDPLEMLRDLHAGLGQAHPVFELAFRRLAESQPPPARRVVVHGDFRIGNLMVGPRGVTGVLDWELTHLGDPHEDLGWLCVRAWRFTRPDRPAAGLGSQEELAAAYARHSGTEVDLDALRWWELLGTLRWGVICVMQAFTHLSGATRSLEHAVIGRRACEVEWDLLELLDVPAEPGSGAVAEVAPTAATFHDRPTATELLDATRGALGDDVLPLLEGRARFQLRVALRALGIVERELEGRARHEAAHGAALERLGFDGEAALATAIRAAEVGEDSRELHAALRATTRAKLEAANPRYLS